MRKTTATGTEERKTAATGTEDEGSRGLVHCGTIEHIELLGDDLGAMSLGNILMALMCQRSVGALRIGHSASCCDEGGQDFLQF